MVRPRLEVADVFRAHGTAWRKANAGHVSLTQLKVMSAIETCRTSALGGHVERCEDCAHERIAYNSCRNRHCPKCQAAAAGLVLERDGADRSRQGEDDVIIRNRQELGLAVFEPLPRRARPTSPQPPRGFLLGRLSDAGPTTRTTGRRPKPFTEADLQLYLTSDRPRRRADIEVCGLGAYGLNS